MYLVLAPTELVERTDALLEPLLARDPKLLARLHDVRKHGATKENHMFSSRRVFNTDLEFLFAEKFNATKPFQYQKWTENDGGKGREKEMGSDVR